MRILYLVYFDLEETKLYGVKKKIFNQLNALNKIGHLVDIAYCHNNELIIQSNDLRSSYPIRKGITNYRNAIYKLINTNADVWKYDVVYIRYPGSIDYSIFKTFKVLHKNKIKVILELPTYPIGGELVDFLKSLWRQNKIFEFGLRSLAYSIHRVLSRRINKYIEKIVTFMPYENIWGVNTVCIDNGVNIEEFYPINKITVKSDKRLTILGVANVEKWHGYDRVLKGISNYYNSKELDKWDITFKIAGDGTEIPTLKEIVNKLKINDKVEFLGMQTSEQLLKLYQNTDIAISSLALHRIGIEVGSTLKTKEYCAYGVPFVYGYTEKELDIDFPFALKISADDFDIDIEKIIKFFSEVLKVEDYSNKMHQFAKVNYDWVKQMGKIFDV